MNRGIKAVFLGVALLLATMSAAWAETSSSTLDLQRRAYREHSYDEGLKGRTMLRVHGGLSLPTGDFDNAVNTGWGLGGSVGYGIGRSTIISWGLAVHHFGEEAGDGHVNIVPVTAGLDYGFDTRGSIRPWIGGGLGVYRLSETITVPGLGDVTDSESDFGFNLGGGIAGRMRHSDTAWGVGLKFHHIAGSDFPDTDFMALQGGFSFEI